MTVTVDRTRTRFVDGRRIVLDESARLLNELDSGKWDAVGALLSTANVVFVIGNGRSGLAAQMAAMRLMHLGLRVHVAGEVTAPAVAGGDMLIAVSGSGATASVVDAAAKSKTLGAKVVAVTARKDSPLARLADEVLTLPAADKQDRSESITRQYAGSLFEQAVILAFDALFHALWRRSNQSAEELWRRHANIG